MQALLAKYLKEIHREISYGYASLSMERNIQRYRITMAQLRHMFTEVYKEIYKSDIERWPHPDLVVKKGNGFEKAARACFNKYAEIAAKNKKTRIKYQTRDVLEFTIPQENRKITVEAKTAGLRALDKAIQATGAKGIQFYEDIKRAEKEDEGEDFAFRQLMHREHSSDQTATAKGMFAGKIQALELKFKGIADDFFAAVQESKSAADYFGDINTTFEIYSNDYVNIQLKDPKAEINRSLVAWSANPSGATRGDIGPGGARTLEFDALMQEAFKRWYKRVSLAEKEKLVNTDNLVANLGNKLTDLMVYPFKKGMRKGKTVVTVSEARRAKKTAAINKTQTIKSKPITAKARRRQVVSVEDVKVAEKIDRASALRLKEVLQMYITETVTKNMGPPGEPSNPAGPLHWRTGRFAQSVMVPHVFIKKDGSPSVMFRYMEYPYRVFEGHPTRNPRLLIEKSITEILRDYYAKNRLRYMGETTRRGPKVAFQPRKKGKKS